MRLWKTVRRLALRAYLFTVRQFRRSLQVRVVALTLILSMAAVLLVGSYVSREIARGLYEAKLQSITSQTAGYASELEATATTEGIAQLSETVNTQLRGMMARSSTPLRSIALEPRDRGRSVAPIIALPYGQEPVRPSELDEEFLSRAQETPAGTQTYQSITLPGAQHSPGIVVAQTVSLPGSGKFDLYVVADLQEEQNTLSFIQRALTVAGIVMVVLVVAVAWLVTGLVVSPIRSTARAALRLADGDLDERVTVTSHDELGALGRSFNDMADTLQDQIVRMKELTVQQRQFVSDVSHELRTPLATIGAATEMLYVEKDELDETGQRSLELLKSQVERFELLLSDLLEVSRHDAGFVKLETTEQDITEIVSNVVDGLTFVAEQSGSQIVMHTPSTPVTAEVEQIRIGRILRNLIVNAIEHGEKKNIDVYVAATAESCAVSIRDHGIGLTADQVEHVFDRFWRGDPSRRRTLGGTGLGLAIALEDAHLHGGWLQAWGSPGDGACFRLTLPRKQGTELTSSPLPLPPADAPSSAPALIAGPATSDGAVRVQTGSIPIVVETAAPADEADEDGGQR